MSTITVTTASGSTDTFALGFDYIAASHVEVRLDGTLKTPLTHYNVVGSNVVFVGGDVAAGVKVLRRRITPKEALVVYVAGALNEQSLNDGDKQSRYIAEEAFDHSEYVKTLLVGIDVEEILEAQAEVEADRAEVADNAEAVELARIEVATNTAIVEADEATVAGYRTDVQGYLSTASLAADASASAQVAAEAARDQVLSLYDSFDDRYLGAKAADPTVDNDGNALVAGQLYFNTTDEVMKLYTGSLWTAAYVSGDGVALLANNGSDYTASSFRANLDLYSTTEVLALPFGRTAKTTLVDADTIGMTDSAASNAWKKITWANLKSQMLAALQAVAWTMTAKITTVASTTGGAGLNLPHGAAPSSPTNGDTWTTTSGLLARINGTTQTLLHNARSVATQHSLTGGGDLSADRTLSLVNDTASPGNNMVYGTNGSGTRGWKADPTGGWTEKTTVAASGQTSIDFTSIPAGVKAIVVEVVGLSTSGTSYPIIQLGDSGGPETNGYLATGGVVAGSAAATAFTAGIGLSAGTHTAAAVLHGSVMLTRSDASANKWVAQGVIGWTNTAVAVVTAGSKALSAALDRVRITTVNGTDTLDAGEVNVIYMS